MSTEAPRSAIARFSVGEAVKVIALQRSGHVRTPDYIIGHTGQVVQFCGFFLNPEDLSIGHTAGPMVALYRIEFFMSSLWKEQQHNPLDALCIEVYDHWLARV